MIRYVYATSNQSDNYSWFIVHSGSEKECLDIVKFEHQHDDEIEPDYDIMDKDEALERTDLDGVMIPSLDKCECFDYGS